MWKRNPGIRKSVSLWLAFLVLCLHSYCLEPSMEEETVPIKLSELSKLEETLTKQKQLIEMQKLELNMLQSSITISNDALMNASTSFEMYEKETKKDKWRVGFTVGGVTFLIGGLTGILCCALIK